MPTYQYACTSAECGLRFERIQAFTDDAITACPDCSDRVRKVYGSVGVVFKGSGFYRNDSRDAKAGGAPVKAETSESSKSDGASDKPAAEKTAKVDAAATKSDSGKSDSGKSDSGSSKKSTSSERKTAAPVAS